MKMTTTTQHASRICSGGVDGVLQIEEGTRNGVLKSYTQEGGRSERRPSLCTVRMYLPTPPSSTSIKGWAGERGVFWAGRTACTEMWILKLTVNSENRVFNVLRVWVALGRMAGDGTTEGNWGLIVPCLYTFYKCEFCTRCQRNSA